MARAKKYWKLTEKGEKAFERLTTDLHCKFITKKLESWMNQVEKDGFYEVEKDELEEVNETLEFILSKIKETLDDVQM